MTDSQQWESGQMTAEWVAEKAQELGVDESQIIAAVGEVVIDTKETLRDLVGIAEQYVSVDGDTPAGPALGALYLALQEPLSTKAETLAPMLTLALWTLAVQNQNQVRLEGMLDGSRRAGR